MLSESVLLISVLALETHGNALKFRSTEPHRAANSTGRVSGHRALGKLTISRQQILEQ